MERRGLPPDEANQEISFIEPQAPYLSPTSEIRGWPGYRTRPGRSGYDYLDTEFELAHMEGIFLKYLFTGKCRTRNPVYLFFLTVFGLLASMPLIFGVVEVFTGNLSALVIILLLSPYIAVGIAALCNVFLSIDAMILGKH